MDVGDKVKINNKNAVITAVHKNKYDVKFNDNSQKKSVSRENITSNKIYKQNDNVKILRDDNVIKVKIEKVIVDIYVKPLSRVVDVEYKVTKDEISLFQYIRSYDVKNILKTFYGKDLDVIKNKIPVKFSDYLNKLKISDRQIFNNFFNKDGNVNYDIPNIFIQVLKKEIKLNNIYINDINNVLRLCWRYVIEPFLYMNPTELYSFKVYMYKLEMLLSSNLSCSIKKENISNFDECIINSIINAIEILQNNKFYVFRKLDKKGDLYTNADEELRRQLIDNDNKKEKDIIKYITSLILGIPTKLKIQRESQGVDLDTIDDEQDESDTEEDIYDDEEDDVNIYDGNRRISSIISNKNKLFQELNPNADNIVYEIYKKIVANPLSDIIKRVRVNFFSLKTLKNINNKKELPRKSDIQVTRFKPSTTQNNLTSFLPKVQPTNLASPQYAFKYPELDFEVQDEAINNMIIDVEKMKYKYVTKLSEVKEKFGFFFDQLYFSLKEKDLYDNFYNETVEMLNEQNIKISSYTTQGENFENMMRKMFVFLTDEQLSSLIDNMEKDFETDFENNPIIKEKLEREHKINTLMNNYFHKKNKTDNDKEILIKSLRTKFMENKYVSFYEIDMIEVVLEEQGIYLNIFYLPYTKKFQDEYGKTMTIINELKKRNSAYKERILYENLVDQFNILKAEANNLDNELENIKSKIISSRSPNINFITNGIKFLEFDKFLEMFEKTNQEIESPTYYRTINSPEPEYNSPEPSYYDIDFEYRP